VGGSGAFVADVRASRRAALAAMEGTNCSRDDYRSARDRDPHACGAYTSTYASYCNNCPSVTVKKLHPSRPARRGRHGGAAA